MLDRSASVIILGVPHSSTTPLARAYQLLGWYWGETDVHFWRRIEAKWSVNASAEIISYLRDNLNIEGTDKPFLPEDFDGKPDVDRARQRFADGYRNTRKPMVLKDARFAITLPFFWGAIREIEPNATVVHLRKENNLIVLSHARRNQQKGNFGLSIHEIIDARNKAAAECPLHVETVQWKDVRAAAQQRDKSLMLNALKVDPSVVNERQIECVMNLIEPDRDWPNHPRQGRSGW